MIPLFKFEIKGHSMEPTLLDGRIIFISSIPYLISRPKIGDMVAFRQKSKIFIKRLIKISNGNYFVKGDNTKDSLDSRNFGWISKKDIVGKVIGKI